MTLSIPDALRAMQWLLVPSHLLAVYSEQVLVHMLALVGMLALARLAVSRYGRALAALTLAATLTASATPHPRAPARRRPAFEQRRLVHAAHPATSRATAAASVTRPAAPSTSAQKPAPEPCGDRLTPRPARVVAPRPAMPSESELVTLANTAVIGPLIEACRQAAGGAR